MTLRAVFGHDRVRGALAGEESHVAGAVARHPRHQRVGGIEHGGAFGRYVLHDDALDGGQFGRGVDEIHAEVVALADVGNHRHITAIESQPFAQDATARRFQHGGVHVRMSQHVAGATRTTAIAGINKTAIGIHAVGRRHADALAGLVDQVGGQANGGGLAVGTRDGDHRDTAVVIGGEHLADDGFADWAALAVGWA